MNQLETDYLVIGSGATGMAFVDTLLEETEADIIIVDRFAKPGGHWNYVYPFVTLHQPSQFYGVKSKELSKGLIDKIGLNKGLFDLASGAEVQAYFDEVMRDTFLPSGRVRYYPLCNYINNHQFESILHGAQYSVEVRKKLVDTTYLKTAIPLTHTPSFSIDKEVNLIPINHLPDIASPVAAFTVIGGGKTGIDACLWLLTQGVDPDKITWIVSRDAWLLDRQNTQPTMQFFENTMGSMAHQFEAIAASTSIEDMFDRLEARGVLVRIDKSIRPSMFHGATISKSEILLLQKIKNIIRLGRVRSISTHEIVLDNGSISTSTDTVHVDCSASAVTNLATKPIYETGKITPQTVRAYQPLFSASVIAYIEANYNDDKKKNNLCQVVPLPNHDKDWIKMTAIQMVNQMTWSQEKDLRKWIRSNRLDGFSYLISQVDQNDRAKVDILKRMKAASVPAMMKLQYYLSQHDN